MRVPSTSNKTNLLIGLSAKVLGDILDEAKIIVRAGEREIDDHVRGRMSCV